MNPDLQKVQIPIAIEIKRNHTAAQTDDLTFLILSESFRFETAPVRFLTDRGRPGPRSFRQDARRCIREDHVRRRRIDKPGLRSSRSNRFGVTALLEIVLPDRCGITLRAKDLELLHHRLALLAFTRASQRHC